MSDMSNTERRMFEKLLDMGRGNVLKFSNRTFEEFTIDSTGTSVYDPKYETWGGSKANRLRAFWSSEPNSVVAKLLGDLLQYLAERDMNPEQEQLLENCRRVVLRLSESASVLEIEAITPNTSEKGFATLAKSVRESIEKNEPEAGLDRLHTFVLKYMRTLCQKHGITLEKDKPLHSLFGEYVKRLADEGKIESEMTERILKSSISTLEAFNKVRNNQSFAHDNRILNYEESILIFNYVASTIRYLNAVEFNKCTAEKPGRHSSERKAEIQF